MDKKLLYQGIAVLILVMNATGCRNISKGDTTVKIATAANMQFVMKELADFFTENTGIPCDLIIGSSGKLTAQISEGAPFDVLVAANMVYPQQLVSKGLAAAPARMYARGSLVLWTLRDNGKPSIEKLGSDGIKHIALANPKTAPYGQAAMEVLRHYQILDKVRHKLVYGESIAQVNQFIISGAADAGFTALSVVLARGDERGGEWMAVDPGLHAPIEQGVVLLRRETGPKESARKFYDFLFSREAIEILKKFGYSMDE